MRANSLHQDWDKICVLQSAKVHFLNGQCLHGSGVKNLREEALEVTVNFFLVG